VQGLAPINKGTFAATQGLLGFASFLQIGVWLIMACVQYQAPYFSENKLSLIIVRFLTIGVAFFTTVAVILFGSSPIKNEFCKAFDPDVNYNGTGCGYGNGFNIAIAAIIFSVMQLYSAWFYMTLDLPVSYAFSKQAGGDAALTGNKDSASQVSATFNSYEPVVGSGKAASSEEVSSGAYQSGNGF
jgi:hypothetical protein